MHLDCLVRRVILETGVQPQLPGCHLRTRYPQASDHGCEQFRLQEIWGVRARQSRV